MLAVTYQSVKRTYYSGCQGSFPDPLEWKRKDQSIWGKVR